MSVLLGQGDGAFQAAVAYAAGTTPFAVAAADLTGDGRLDLVVTNNDQTGQSISNSVSVLHGNGDGTFQAPVSYVVGSLAPAGLALGDMNGDHKIDIVTANSHNVSILLGDGDGTFGAAINYAPENGYGTPLVGGALHISGTVALGDLSGDGKLDLITDRLGTILASLNNGDGTFPQARSYDINDYSQPRSALLVAADLNHDGKPDLLAITSPEQTASLNNGPTNISVLLNKGNGEFEAAVSFAVNEGTVNLPPVVGDFNNDGNLDVLLVGGFQASSAAALLAGNGDGTFQAPVYTSSSTGPVTTNSSLLTADVNNDGNLDLILITDSGVDVALGNGNGTFQPARVGISLTVGGVYGAVKGDFNSDGKLDLALFLQSVDLSGVLTQGVKVVLGNGDGAFRAGGSAGTGGPGFAFEFATADFNNDGKQDIAALNNGGTVSLLLGNGDGTLQPPITYDEPLDAGSGAPDFKAFVAADVNGDGAPDLILGNSAGMAVLLHAQVFGVVADAPLIAAGATHSASTNAPFNGVVATFEDTNPNGTLDQFTATITWGDGHTSAGTILSSPGGGFLVTGVNAYTTTGAFNVVVAIVDVDGARVTAASTINVTNAPVAEISTSGTSIASTARLPFTGIVATFMVADTSATANDFLAVIAWGDGHSSVGLIGPQSGSAFSVTGSNIYATSGTYPVVVTIIATGGATATANSSADVATNTDPALTAAGVDIQATAAAAFSGVVATFTDADPAGTVLDYSAIITWGDGQTSTGMVTADPFVAGLFDVTGATTYVKEGSYSVSIAITHKGGAQATATDTAVVADAPLAGQGVGVTATEGIAFTGPAAKFLDADPYAKAGDFTATITWGDGHSSAGLVKENVLVAGLFDVLGTNNYAEEGVFPISATIMDRGGASATTTSWASVGDAPLSANGKNINAAAGSLFSGVMATFTDADPDATTDWTATIAWGDGQITPGTISVDSNGGFDVSGTHTYAMGGNFTFSVAIVDVGGSTATVTATATVSQFPLAATGTFLTGLVEGAGFTGAVAFCTDANPASNVLNCSATIAWGDGQTDPGILVPNPMIAGRFAITGAHTFVEAGSFAITITITNEARISVSAASTAVVLDAPLSAAGVNVATTEGAQFSGTVAAFSDANPNAVANDFTASITWGDGQTSVGTVSADAITGHFDVVGGNIYPKAGRYAINVTITDHDGAVAAATSSGTVADAPLTLVGLSGTSSAGLPFTAAIATFADGNTASVASDFTAIIDWGDGHTSPGKIAVDPTQAGEFVVTGTTTYATAGTYTVSVTVADAGGSMAAATGSWTVGAASTLKISASGDAISAASGTPFIGEVATVAGLSASDLGTSVVTISWGDGTSSLGLIQPASAAPFRAAFVAAPSPTISRTWHAHLRPGWFFCPGRDHCSSGRSAGDGTGQRKGLRHWHGSRGPGPGRRRLRADGFDKRERRPVHARGRWRRRRLQRHHHVGRRQSIGRPHRTDE